MDRWAIFIDIEGTSKIYQAQKAYFYHALDSLLTSVFRIGETVFPESPSRLFAHQVGGDRLVIISEFAEGLPETPISIAVVLMQVLLVNGFVGKGGISDGDFGDVRGCFPDLNDMSKADDESFRMGRGCLTIFPVMGTALINSHRFASQPPKGCRLAIDPALLNVVPSGVILTNWSSEIAVVDWIHTYTSTMELIFEKTGLCLPSQAELKRQLVGYVDSTGALAKGEWGLNSLRLNHC